MYAPGFCGQAQAGAVPQLRPEAARGGGRGELRPGGEDVQRRHRGGSRRWTEILADKRPIFTATYIAAWNVWYSNSEPKITSINKTNLSFIYSCQDTWTTPPSSRSGCRTWRRWCTPDWSAQLSPSTSTPFSQMNNSNTQTTLRKFIE